MEHLLKACIGNGTFELGCGTPARINLNGEETKYKSSEAKDTAKERYHRHCK
jgi:hypothetical protein